MVSHGSVAQQGVPNDPVIVEQLDDWELELRACCFLVEDALKEV